MLQAKIIIYPILLQVYLYIIKAYFYYLPTVLLDDQWNGLLHLISEKKCTPFIGPDAYTPWLDQNIAEKWIKQYGYPLENSHPLAKVAQFLAIKSGDNMYPKNILSRLIKEIQPPDFSLDKNRNTPYSVLADLNLPIYITTNYDHFMEAALKSKGKEPVSEFCRWNEKLSIYTREAKISYAFDKKQRYQPSISQPLVYHLHGDIDIPRSMVLTEKDYFDFVINLNKHDEKSTLPHIIRTALAASSLLFIGYSLEDITFRVIFQGVISLLDAMEREISIAVQLPPHYIKEREEAQQYLDQYTKDMFNLHVYWGDTGQFVAEIQQRWNNFKSTMLSTQLSEKQ
jgi:hypothetical protein